MCCSQAFFLLEQAAKVGSRPLVRRHFGHAPAVLQIARCELSKIAPVFSLQAESEVPRTIVVMEATGIEAVEMVAVVVEVMGVEDKEIGVVEMDMGDTEAVEGPHVVRVAPTWGWGHLGGCGCKPA